MREISYQVKMEVIEMYMKGFSTDEIVKELGISKGAVVSIIADARQGKFPVPGLKDRIDELHKISVMLEKGSLDVSQARLGLDFFKKLQEIGVEPNQLETWIEFCSQIGPSLPEGFFSAAFEFYNLTQKSGKGHSKMLGEVKDLSERKNNLLKEVGDLESKQRLAERLEQQITAADHEIRELQIRTDALRPELHQLDQLLDRKATEIGMTPSELECHLRELVSLEQETRVMRQEKTKLEGEIKALEERESRMSAAMEKASADFRRDLQLIRETEKVLIEIGQRKGQLEQEIKGMEWGAKILRFLSDPDKVDDKDFGLIATVVNCVDKWIVIQPEFRYFGNQEWNHVKRIVQSRRSRLQQSPQ